MPAIAQQLNAFLPGRRETPSRPGWFIRFVHAVQEARLKQAEREVARFIDSRGGRITDTLERQIERRFV